jgi:hypothetical protein
MDWCEPADTATSSLVHRRTAAHASPVDKHPRTPAAHSVESTGRTIPRVARRRASARQGQMQSPTGDVETTQQDENFRTVAIPAEGIPAEPPASPFRGCGSGYRRRAAAMRTTAPRIPFKGLYLSATRY